MARGDTALVVLDLMLPGLDVLELCRLLERDPATSDLPIIMLTAKGDEIDRIVGLEGELQSCQMIRRAILLRHAEAGWSDGSDRDRPLTPDGAAAAGRVGRFLTSLGLEPEAVLSSPAVRARATAELVVEAAGWRNPVQLEETFYGEGSEAVLTHVRRLPEAVGTVLLVGHEPVWSALVSGLAGGGRVRFPTATSACLEADLQGWNELDWGRMELCWLVRPEMLCDGGSED